MKKYRIVEYDIVNGLWRLQERVFLIFWKGLGIGPKTKLKGLIKELIEDEENDRGTRP